MRIAVTGLNGQLALSLRERAAARGFAIGFAARPDVDFGRLETIGPALEALRPDVVVNAAAYTMVDQAEAEEAVATRINGEAAGEVAAQAARLGAPLIQISTDYVFDGLADSPYREDDPVAPMGAYGRSKLAGEIAVAKATPDHVILRTAWVYSPFGKNFVRTMLALGLKRDVLGVVADQVGNPSYAPDIAEGVLSVAQALMGGRGQVGVFHMAGAGDAAWADLAEETFRLAEAHGRAPVRVNRIATADYPTPAKRPANSRLDCAKLLNAYGIALPLWRDAAGRCVTRILQAD